MESEAAHSIGRYDRHFNPSMSRTKLHPLRCSLHTRDATYTTTEAKIWRAPKYSKRSSLHSVHSITNFLCIFFQLYSFHASVSFALTSFVKLPLVPYLFTQFLLSVFPLVFWVPLKHPNLSYVENALEAGGFPLLFSSLDIFSLIFDDLCKDLICHEHIHCSLPPLSPCHAYRFPPS